MAHDSHASLTIDEHLLADGTRRATHVSFHEGDLRIVIDGEIDTAIPMAVFDQVMARYGKPLADGIVLDGSPRIALGDGGALCMLRHRARYDVIARDFLVHVRPNEPPLAELSTSIAAALTHLARTLKEATA